jgi:eukaryotic-like serine/threonine-protein kinase
MEMRSVIVKSYASILTMTLTSGTQLGSYVILTPLGSGGMGEVYKARDSRLNRLVAIKVLAPSMQQDASAMARFEREARILAGLSHPNIVAIHDIGSEGSSPFVVTELLEGETLAELLKKGPLALPRVIAFTLQIAEGLVAAHARGIVHRDLKPSNVFITRDNRVKVLDFGLAKDLRVELDPTLTDALPVPGMTLKGTVMGTVGYMSPEQVRGEATDIRSDLFTLGVLMLEMITGTQAFTGGSAVEVLHAILRADPLEGQKVPPDLLPILQRLLAKSPDDRFQTAKDLRFVLASQGSVSQGHLGIPSSSIRPAQRLVILVATVVLLLGSAGLAWGWRVLTQPKPLPKWTAVSPLPGLISAARFSRDGRVIAYSFKGPDDRMMISTFTEGDGFPSPTGRSGRVVAVGSGKELYLSDPEGYATAPGVLPGGVLYQWNGPQTDLRPASDDIMDADLHPNGKDLAVIRRSPGATLAGATPTFTLEAPLGRELAKFPSWVTSPRWSPDGQFIAYIDRKEDSWAGHIIVVDATGALKFQSSKLRHIRGLAWTPDGQSLVFSHSPEPGALARVVSMDLKGRTRELLSAPTELLLLDVDRQGRLLVASQSITLQARIEEHGQISTPRLPFGLAGGLPPVMSPDGSRIAIVARASALAYTLYVRHRANGGLVKVVANASPLAFSNDNKWLLVQRFDAAQNRHLSYALIPLGLGVERELNSDGLGESQSGNLSDVDHPVVAAWPSGEVAIRHYELSQKNPPKQIASELDNLLTLVHAKQDIWYAYDTNHGLFTGSLNKNQWTPVVGGMSKFIPVARDPKTGELLAIPQGEVLPWDETKPMGRLSLHRMTPGHPQIKLDRVLDLTGMGVWFRAISFSADACVMEHKEYLDRLMIVEGVLPEFR